MSETAKPKAKPKRKVETYTFDGVTVELRQVDPDRRNAPENSHMFGPATRSKWEIHVNGQHLGFAFYPLGVGQNWIVCTLEPKDIDPTFGPVLRWWETGPTGEHGGWEETGGCWDGLAGLLARAAPRQPGSQYKVSGWKWTDRPQIAAGVARMFRDGDLPDIPGVERKIATAKRRREERARKDAEDTARYAREREEAKVAAAAAAVKAEEQRAEALMGLESIRDRLGKDVLTNLELAALATAITRFGG